MDGNVCLACGSCCKNTNCNKKIIFDDIYLCIIKNHCGNKMFNKSVCLEGMKKLNIDKPYMIQSRLDKIWEMKQKYDN